MRISDLCGRSKRILDRRTAQARTILKVVAELPVVCGSTAVGICAEDKGSSVTIYRHCIRKKKTG